jgi:bacteriocin-like protein
MAEKSNLEPEDLTAEPAEFEVEELNDDELEGVSGGESNNGCTITVNNAAGC